MKKAIVFGGSGFIGRHLIEELLNNKWSVTNFDINRIELPYDNYSFVKGDICLSNNIDDFFKEQPEAVINLSAMSSIEECNTLPYLAFHYNVLGNSMILNAMVRNYKEPPLYVYASSLYAQSSKSGAYGITKKQSEEWVKYYADKHNFPYLILRYGTVYGPGAQSDNSVRKVIEYALREKVISYYGSGEEIRNYVHVKDVAKSTIDLMQPEHHDKTFNILGINPIKSRDFVYLLRDILGNDYKVEFRGEDSHIDHYQITPYDYDQDIAYNYTPRKYIDFGLGLLGVIKENG